MHCGCVTTAAERIRHLICHSAVQRSQLLLKSPANLRNGLRSSKIWLFSKSNLIASWQFSCRVWEHSASLQGGLEASRSLLKHWWGHPQCLGGLSVAFRPIYILLMKKRRTDINPATAAALNNCWENMPQSLLRSLRSCLCCSQSLLQTCAGVSAALKVSCRPAQRSQQLHDLMILVVNLIASWIHLHNCRCFQELLKMFLQSRRAHCIGPGGPGRIWKYLAALVSATGESGWFACGFWTDLHFADGCFEKCISLCCSAAVP